MAWIQAHQQLRDHRKTLYAADALGIEPAHMIGLLVSFWLWALDNAPSGSLDGISNRTIARAAQWNGDSDDFTAVLRDSGFLDTDEDGKLCIHDWYEYAGKLVDQREAERERSRRRRAAESAVKKATSNDRRSTAGRLDQSRVDNSRVDNRGNTPIPPTDDIDAPNLQERRFDEFWKAYPKKVGKIAAQKAWKKIKMTEALFGKIMLAISEAKKSEQWCRENGRYIPNPSTWLNQGRWDDEPMTVDPSSPTSAKLSESTFNTKSVLASIIANEGNGDEYI